MEQILDILFEQKDIKSLIEKSGNDYVYSQLFKIEENSKSCHEKIRLLSILISYISGNLDNSGDIQKEALNNTYIILKTVDIKDAEYKVCFDEILSIDGLASENLYYFLLSSISLKLEKSINIRLDLKRFKCSSISTIDNWKYRLLNKSIEAFLLLVRKDNGFEDIRQAFNFIIDLQKDQKEFEQTYLDGIDADREVREAYELLGYYHLSKSILETAKYLQDGYNYKERLEVVVRQHIDTARKLFTGNQQIINLSFLLEDSLKNLELNSIWTKTRFNDSIQKLCKLKSELGYIELLPSQRQAIDKNLLDVASNVTVVQMPTSAGKSLLAEFNILVTKALKKDAKIVYVVPSRALVNQIYFDLKNDLEALNLSIEKTSSAIELDPNENAFLLDDIDILVSTPEKLDLLVRRNHPSVDNVSLFIIDEAHSIQSGQRGAKLELLLAILKRERPSAKFMLLSPFVGSSGEIIKEWLGGGNAIEVDWKPAEKIIIGLDVGSKQGNDVFKFSVLPSQFGFQKDEQLKKLDNPYILKSTTKTAKLFEFTAKHFAKEDRCVLFLCKGKGTVNTKVEVLYNVLDNEDASDEINIVRKFIKDEVGEDTILSKVLSKRIATHHAGMSDETKLLVEHLIRQKQIDYICSTMTVAEGVNFPVSTVYFDTYWKRDKMIDSNDFWNIAGRAGRTMVDNFGKVILPFNDTNNRNKGRSLVSDSAKEIVSVLSELFVNGDKILSRLDRANVSLKPLLQDYGDSLGPLIQYFVHLLTVSNNQPYVAEIEDLFKDTFEYYQLETSEQKARFVQICREIYNHLESKYKDKGILSFADKTGFSVPSVLNVMMEKSTNPAISNLDSWNIDTIFNQSNLGYLTEKVRVISELRETRMGTDSTESQYEPENIAKILMGWVKGSKYNELSHIHPAFSSINDSNKRISEFVSKMNDIRFKASWGLSALEGIVKGKEDEIQDSSIPSLVYFGVDNEQALLLRMIGIPRMLSFSMAKLIEKPLNTYSFSSLRKTIKSLTNSDWDALTPKGSSLNSVEWKYISDVLVK